MKVRAILVTTLACTLLAVPAIGDAAPRPQLKVEATAPQEGATEVPVDVSPTVRFNRDVTSAEVSMAGGGGGVAIDTSYDAATRTEVITPRERLAYATRYTLSVTARDAVTGAAMAKPYSWSFTTATAAPRPIANDCSAGTVAFTFDDGPNVNTPAVLAKLRELNLWATFFVVGERIEGDPFGQQAVRDAVAAGFGVQNHTYSHRSLTGASTGTAPLTDAEINDELDRASAAVVAAGAPRPTLYRPPYGDIDARSDVVARDAGYRVVMSWGGAGGNIVDSRDWTSASTEEIVRNVTVGYTDPRTGRFYPGMAPDAIIAMHDGGYDGTRRTIAALQPIVDWMNEHRYCSTATIRPDATGGVVPVPPPAPPTEGNLVRNPSLETMRTVGGVPTGVPECFQRAGASTSSTTATWSQTADAHSGSVAERVEVTAWTAGDRKLVVSQLAAQAACPPPASPGRSYSLWAWYKGSWGAPARAALVSYYRTGSGTAEDPYAWHYWQTGPTLAPAQSWQLAYLSTAPAPAGANAISYGIALTGVGTVVTDDYTAVPN